MSFALPRPLLHLSLCAQGGSTTAGNSSQTSDGAAVVLLARRSAAKKHNLPILGTFVSFAVVGVEPAVMGAQSGLVFFV